jgi:hypothetical protein
MRYRLDRTVLLILITLVAGCIHTEEGEVKGVIGDLVTAINDQDRAAAATLFTGRRLDPVMPNGDSSAIYRLTRPRPRSTSPAR